MGRKFSWNTYTEGIRKKHRTQKMGLDSQKLAYYN